MRTAHLTRGQSRSPGFRARSVHTCQGLRPRRTGASLALTRIRFAFRLKRRRRPVDAFAARWLAYAPPADASPPASRRRRTARGRCGVATPSSQWTHMGVFGSSGQVHRHIKKLRWLFRYPRSEPYFMTWLVPHQIKLTSGRRSKQLHQYPAFGGWGSGGRDHSFTRLFKPVHCSVRSPGSVRTG